MTTPLLRRLIHGSEIWDAYRVSAFAARFENAGTLTAK
jgi:hypothetical protein